MNVRVRWVLVGEDDAERLTRSCTFAKPQPAPPNPKRRSTLRSAAAPTPFMAEPTRVNNALSTPSALSTLVAGLCQSLPMLWHNLPRSIGNPRKSLISEHGHDACSSELSCNTSSIRFSHSY